MIDTHTHARPFLGHPLGEGAKFAAGGRVFAISYRGGTGNDVVLTALGNRHLRDRR